MIGSARRFVLFVSLSISLLALAPIPSTAKTNCAKSICIQTLQSGSVITLRAINKKRYLPVTLTISLKLENMRVFKGRTGTFVLKGGAKRRLLKLRPRRRGRWRYRYNYKWARGDYTAQHNKKQIYRLPYAAGAQFQVMQGCNGAFSHNGAGRYAIDFQMPIGTPVHAARGGRVVDVLNSSDKGGPDRSFIEFDNRVVIQHRDRTLSVYSHFRRGGVVVRPGRRVKAGQLIGYSGNTGFSTGPHLHFAVTKGAANAAEEITLPVAFSTDGGPVTCPNPGARLIAR